MSTQFEPGAPAGEGFIPLCVPEIAPHSKEWTYVKQCLDSTFVSSVGEFVNRFERQMAEFVGTRFAVACVTGTAAIHVALLAAGVEPDDEVFVSDLTFIAPANAIRYANAWPILVDAEPDYWEMDANKLSEFIVKQCHWNNGELRNRTTGRRIRAILPVHILGHPVDLDPIIGIARKYDLRVVEDATESLGAKYKNRNVGTLGDVACLSFNGNKLITTGGGGMIITDDEAIAARARYLTTQAKDDPLEYVHGEVGFNYRLTNIQAALGCAQAENLPAYIAKKRHIASAYDHALAAITGITPMPRAPWAESASWLYTALIDGNEYGLDSRQLLHDLDRNKIQTRPLWQPLHLSKPHRGAPRTDCSVAEELNRRALSLPSSVGLTDEQQARVIDAIAALRPMPATAI